MNPVRILIDSTADVTPQAASRMGIVPLTIHFGEEHYVDGVDIDRKTFYEKMAESDVLPTTSQATPFAFAQRYQEAMDAGEDVVVVTISSLLSGTYQSAVIAAEDFPEGRIFVVDSRNVTMGSAVLAQYGLELADQGRSAAEIAKTLTEERDNVHLIALLDTLDYLKKGGRISSAVALAGGLLSIKPAISLDGGEVKLIGTARGAKQGTALLDKKVTEAGGIDFDRPVLLGYTGSDDALLKKYMSDSTLLQGHSDLPVGIVCGVVGVHAGPGAMAVGFFQKN